MHRSLKILIVFLFLISFTSCDRMMVYDKFVHIEESSWNWDDPAEFEVELPDTLSFHNILVRLRHSTEYPLSNLYMFVHVTGPSGQKMSDTLNFKLAESNGKWLGTGMGDRREIAYMFKQNTRFPESGTYHFSLEQAMRLPEVPVSELGLRIEKVEP